MKECRVITMPATRGNFGKTIVVTRHRLHVNIQVVTPGSLLEFNMNMVAAMELRDVLKEFYPELDTGGVVRRSSDVEPD